MLERVGLRGFVSLGKAAVRLWTFGCGEKYYREQDQGDNRIIGRRFWGETGRAKGSPISGLKKLGEYEG
jgi:hypothetical protein